MPARFYAPDARDVGQIVALPDFEAEHLTRVLRLGAGAGVQLFDGRGQAFDGVVERTLRRSADVRVTAPRAAAPERGVRVTLAPALLKGDKMDDVVRDAVMLGVAAIQPVLAERSEIPRAALARSSRQERWHRIAVSSAKQCGRAVVPAVHPPVAAAALLDIPAEDREEALTCMFVEPGAGASATASLAGVAPAPRNAVLLIGPEGGWSDAELGAAGPAVRRVTLRGPTLRADAMPLVALTALFAAWGEL